MTPDEATLIRLQEEALAAQRAYDEAYCRWKAAKEKCVVGGMKRWVDGHASAHAPTSAPRSEVVVLCGSMRFTDQFREQTLRLERGGVTVLGPTVACPGTPAGDLFALHRHKIDAADRVLVLNVGGYVGDSTRSEIEYAESRGKPVDYLVAAFNWADHEEDGVA